jgi:hypothetical protein
MGSGMICVKCIARAMHWWLMTNWRAVTEVKGLWLSRDLGCCVTGPLFRCVVVRVQSAPLVCAGKGHRLPWCRYKWREQVAWRQRVHVNLYSVRWLKYTMRTTLHCGTFAYPSLPCNCNSAFSVRYFWCRCSFRLEECSALPQVWNSGLIPFWLLASYKIFRTAVRSTTMSDSVFLL